MRAILHQLLEIAAFIVAAWLYSRTRKQRGDALDDRSRSVVLIGGAVGALVGSRLLGSLEHPTLFAGLTPLQALVQFYSCKSIVGALLGALVAIEAVKALIGERRRSGDLLTYPLLAGLLVGRIGCFAGGVDDGTVGLPSDLPWALDQGDGVPRHPASLYEIAFLLLLWRALLLLERRRELLPGYLFACFLSAYLAWRLAIDFLKPAEVIRFGLSPIQWACVGGLAHYARFFVAGSRARRAVQTQAS